MGLHEATNQLKQMAIIRGVFRLLAGSGSSAYTPVLFLHALLLGLPFRCSTWKPAGTMYRWIKGTKESYTHHNQSKYWFLWGCCFHKIVPWPLQLIGGRLERQQNLVKYLSNKKFQYLVQWYFNVLMLKNHVYCQLLETKGNDYLKKYVPSIKIKEAKT